jgi:hypothetical protein
MSVLTTGAFWAATVERAVRTAAQTAFGILTTNAATPLEIDWQQTALATALAAGLSILMSLGATGVGNVGPSFTTEELTPPAPAVPADGV